MLPYPPTGRFIAVTSLCLFEAEALLTLQNRNEVSPKVDMPRLAQK